VGRGRNESGVKRRERVRELSQRAKERDEREKMKKQ